MVLPADWLNDAADAITAASNFTHVGLLNSGTELAGGSPAYARKAPTFGATANGDKSATGIVFDVPAGATVNHLGFYTALSGGSPTPTETVTAETFGAQGTYTLTVNVDVD